jgi:hypothetical protein
MSQPELSRTEVVPDSAALRSSPRFVPHVRSKVTCYTGPCGLGMNVARALLDVSQTGARLLVTQELTAGREVEVGLLGAGQTRRTIRAAHVVWCVATAEGGFCVGLRFQKPLAEADLQLLL